MGTSPTEDRCKTCHGYVPLAVYDSIYALPPTAPLMNALFVINRACRCRPETTPPPPTVPAIRLRITLLREPHHGRPMGRDYLTPHLPAAGDPIGLCQQSDDPSDGPESTVQRRWWAPDGTANLQLVPYFIDPGKLRLGQMRAANQKAIITGGDGWTDWHPWYTSAGGDLAAMLLAGGWYDLDTAPDQPTADTENPA